MVGKIHSRLYFIKIVIFVILVSHSVFLPLFGVDINLITFQYFLSVRKYLRNLPLSSPSEFPFPTYYATTLLLSIKLDYSFSGFILYNCSKVVRVSTKLYPIKLLCPTKLTTTPNNSSHCRMKDYYHENDDFYEVKFRSEFFAPLFRGMAIAEFTYTKKTLRERTLLLTFKLPLAFENTTLLFF